MQLSQLRQAQKSASYESVVNQCKQWKKPWIGGEIIETLIKQNKTPQYIVSRELIWQKLEWKQQQDLGQSIQIKTKVLPTHKTTQWSKTDAVFKLWSIELLG